MQDRTSSFACFDDEKDYKDNSLISKSLPWVVRVYFQSENSINGVLCSGKKCFSDVFHGPLSVQSGLFFLHQLLKIIILTQKL